MFVLTTLVYPCVLALLCMGAGLAVDRMSGGYLPGALLPAVGVAALIAVSQLSTYIAAVAPSTAYALAAVAAAGFALGWRRVQTFARGWREHRWWQLAIGVLAYVIALAPVLFAGRPTFSAYQSLTDSALHMLGADYLMRHGQEYAHLDLRNSYGQYIHSYYATGYPSGSDTLFGGSAFLLGLPLIWAFQPFNAFVLATATGPAWVLVRRMGLAGGWAALAALTATVPALVYGYELIASVKEITSLGMILTLGALVALHARWLWRRTGVIPPAIVLAAGASALGVGFGAWGLAAAVVVGVVAIRDVMASRHSARQLLLLIATAGAFILLCALSTWIDLAGSLHVAQSIASTSNPGNLSAPLRPVQTLGTWLVGSYEQAPAGAHLTLSYAIALVTLIAVVLGALRVVYMGEYALAGWIGLTLAAGAGLAVYSTAWVSAKALVLSSSVLVLLAWAGIAALRASANPRWLRIAAVLVAVALVGGIAASDAMQYHASDLAPTARYEELASLNKRFAGRGPALFTDFDEYALYELRDLDVGGLDFMYPPLGLRLTRGHGSPIDLDRVPPAAWGAYPLIVTQRDPLASDPPSAYRLAWQGTYYEMWQRRPGAPTAIAHLGLSSTRPAPCASVARMARIAESHDGAQLIAASPPETVMLDIAGAGHPSWTYTHPGLVLSGAGELSAVFELPHGGAWEMWLQGELMPSVQVSVDARHIASIGGQLAGNPHNPDTMTPLRVTLSAGKHRLTITRGGANLAPGDGGEAILHEIFLTPANEPDVDTLHTTPTAQWRELCGRRLDWIEVV